ncbi:3 [Maize fine streak virus]|uniref:3 protein n=1 Tax=Maize fine streak virus TaxID=209854 RepID=Q6E0X6_9RHAB|nr:3 [Maize fine streak nucleorhabdovirus] [Maize fine streak virus]AAT66746.1 3 [Maize fine streak nucleorhabdovirus] [Maize fine streak virus]
MDSGGEITQTPTRDRHVRIRHEINSPIGSDFSISTRKDREVVFQLTDQGNTWFRGESHYWVGNEHLPIIVTYDSKGGDTISDLIVEVEMKLRF